MNKNLFSFEQSESRGWLKGSYFLVLPLIYFSVLFQFSFLVHFFSLPYFLNFFLSLGAIIAIIINLLEEKQGRVGLVSAFSAGLFLDIFSDQFFGFNIIVLLVICLFIKYIIKNYVGIPCFKKI